MKRSELKSTLEARDAGAMPDQRSTLEQLRDLYDVSVHLGLYDAGDALRSMCERIPIGPRPFVFAIRGVFCDRIFADPTGPIDPKTWEFRRREPRMEVGDVFLIYRTAPTSKIVGYARAGRIITGTPATVWDRASHGQGIDRADYDRYFEDRAFAAAIQIVDPTLLDEPISLPRRVSAPQSWSRWKGDWPLVGVPC